MQVNERSRRQSTYRVFDEFLHLGLQVVFRLLWLDRHSNFRQARTGHYRLFRLLTTRLSQAGPKTYTRASKQGGKIYLLLHLVDRLRVGRQMGRDRAQEPSVGRRDVLRRPLDIAVCRAEELGYFGSLRLIGTGG
jgi:hypothetical protein